MNSVLEYDIIKSIKFLLILGGILYLMLLIQGVSGLCIILLVVHIASFLFDLTHRISKGRWRYKPY